MNRELIIKAGEGLYGKCALQTNQIFNYLKNDVFEETSKYLKKLNDYNLAILTENHVYNPSSLELYNMIKKGEDDWSYNWRTNIHISRRIDNILYAGEQFNIKNQNIFYEFLSNKEIKDIEIFNSIKKIINIKEDIEESNSLSASDILSNLESLNQIIKKIHIESETIFGIFKDKLTKNYEEFNNIVFSSYGYMKNKDPKMFNGIEYTTFSNINLLDVCNFSEINSNYITHKEQQIIKTLDNIEVLNSNTSNESNMVFEKKMLKDISLSSSIGGVTNVYNENLTNIDSIVKTFFIFHPPFDKENFFNLVDDFTEGFSEAFLTNTIFELIVDKCTEKTNEWRSVALSEKINQQTIDETTLFLEDEKKEVLKLLEKQNYRDWKRRYKYFFHLCNALTQSVLIGNFGAFLPMILKFRKIYKEKEHNYIKPFIQHQEKLNQIKHSDSIFSKYLQVISSEDYFYIRTNLEENSFSSEIKEFFGISKGYISFEDIISDKNKLEYFLKIYNNPERESSKIT